MCNIKKWISQKKRLHILNEMRKTIDAPRPHLSKYAPKIITMNINPDKLWY